MLKKIISSIPTIFVAAFISTTAQAQTTVFDSDFTGSSPWNFDSETDPQGQLGVTSTDELEYTFATSSNSDTSLLEKALDFSTINGGAETGTLTVSGQVDLGDFQFGASDFSKRTFLEIGTANGNKGAFDGSGMLYELGVGGFNSPGEFRFEQSVAIRFQDGSSSNDASSSFTVPGTDSIYDFEATIEVTGDDTNGWTINADTDYTNATDGTISTSSSFSDIQAPFDGLQSIDKIRVGFEDDNNPTTGTFTMNEVSVTAIPEPSAYALLVSLASVVCVAVRRRR